MKTMKKYPYLLLAALGLASCGSYHVPPFGTSGNWNLVDNMVINSDMAVDFGGNGILANAGNGEYDLHFITSQDGFNAYDPKCAKYITDVLKQIPLKIDSVEVILADQYLILSTNATSAWEPDYVRRADGAILTVQANPVQSLRQPHDELWRNLIINKSKHQIIVVDRLIRNNRHYAIVYVLQSESKSSPLVRNIQFDITGERNIQSTGTMLESLMDKSIDAWQNEVQVMSYDDYIMRADSCFMRGDYVGASNAFGNAFGMKTKIQGTHLYNGACAAAMAGLSDVAFERLNMRLMKDKNWYVDDPNRDSDLKNLHSDVRWKTYCDTIIARRDRAEAAFDMPLRRRLQEIGRSDQDVRYEFLAAYNAHPRNQALVDSLIAQMQRVDSINQCAISEILDTRGFVGRDKVGDASAVYWLVIQHAPVEMQKKYFSLFVDAMERGDLARSQVAMMDDRIALHEGRPQKYGSQIVENDKGERVIYQLLDPAQVDQWRKAMDLPPLADYKKQMGVKE